GGGWGARRGTPARGPGLSTGSQRVETPRSRTRRGDVQPDEAEQDGRRSLIQDRPEAVRRVPDEIGERHFARDQKGYGPTEQSDEQEQTADGFQHRCDADSRRQRGGTAVRQNRRGNGEPLRRAELHE